MKAFLLYLSDILRGISSHPARSALSFFGIAIGTASLCMLITVAGGLREKARHMREEFGANVFSILQQSGDPERRQPVQQPTVRYLRENLAGAHVTACEIFNLPADGDIPPFRLIKTDEFLPAVRPWKMAAGRFLDPSDIRQQQRAIVLSRALAAQTKRHPGDTLTIHQAPFTVVGIIDTATSADESDGLDTRLHVGELAAFIPWSLKSHWAESRYIPEERIDAIFVKPVRSADFHATLEQARLLMSHPDRRLPDLEWITPEHITARIRQWQRLIEWTAGGIALLCLALGGATLMSLMVSNIQERVPEIGLRISLGASSARIVALFVGEALATTLLAATVGAAFAYLLISTAEPHLPLPLLMTWPAYGLSMSVTILMGALFSIWPALAASRISPAEALRND